MNNNRAGQRAQTQKDERRGLNSDLSSAQNNDLSIINQQLQDQTLNIDNQGSEGMRESSIYEEDFEEFKDEEDEGQDQSNLDPHFHSFTDK